MIDVGKVGHVAAELMESVADDHDGEHVEVGTVMLIVELQDTDGWSMVTRCSDSRDWVKLGLIEAVAADIRKYITDDDGDDD